MSSPSTDDVPTHAPDQWEGFTHAEALAWSRVVLRFLPHPVGAGVLGAASSAHAAGRPPSGTGWAERARTAVALGFTPTTFAAWRTSLTWVPANRYAAHPHNHTVEWPTHQPGHTFDAEVWAGWPLLLAQGLSPEAATHYALLRAEEAGFDSSDSTAYAAARTYDDQYESVLAHRRARHGIDERTHPQRWADADSRTRDRLRRDLHESTQTFRERSIRAQAEAEAAHARNEVRTGFARAQQRWADAQKRAAELRDSIANGAVRDEKRRRRH